MDNILITGGAGFIGTNSAEYFLSKGKNVFIFDNLSRKGTKENFDWLKKKFPEKVSLIHADIVKDFDKLVGVVKDKDFVLHLAGQVAVTTSIQNPRNDFEDNALGTFNVLEAMRKVDSNASLIYASTNKVYGGLEQIEIIEKDSRYTYKDFPNGIPETAPLDFHSPYGCSKGAGDQYVRDYARIYGLNSVVFRQSCIYGPRQFGIEDQGWIAWFTIASMFDKKLSIFGDGKQVRDVLYVGDLIRAYDLANQKMNSIKGQVFNVGGGIENTMSLLELLDYLKEFFEKEINFDFADARPGDQKVYVSDISKIKEKLGWTPKVSVKEGVKKLSDWIAENKDLIKMVLGNLI